MLTLNMICLSGSQIFSRIGRSSGFLLMTGSAVMARRDCKLDHVARCMHKNHTKLLGMRGLLPGLPGSSRKPSQSWHSEAGLTHARSLSLLVSIQEVSTLQPVQAQHKTAGTQKDQLTHCLKHLLHSLQQTTVSINM